MSIRTVHRYTRAEIRAAPSTIFVFGDNLLRQGRGGQAKECRDEPNTVGIPTKHRPSMEESAFFSDSDFDFVRPHIQEGFRRLAAHLAEGGDVVWPTGSVGTGLADLPRRSPRIWAFIQRCRSELERRANIS